MSFPNTFSLFSGVDEKLIFSLVFLGHAMLYCII